MQKLLEAIDTKTRNPDNKFWGKYNLYIPELIGGLHWLGSYWSNIKVYPTQDEP